jgi:hypothetical protein
MVTKLLVSLLVAALAVAMALGAVAGVTSATIHISQIANPLWRAAATLAELAAGILWLLITVFLATRLAVLIFRERDPKPGP